MSRLALTFSLIASLTTAALATPNASRPANAPSPAPVAISVDYADPPLGDRVAPRPVPDRAKVRAMLAASRRANLARFRAYQKRGVFPSNVLTSGELNVWLDGAGHFCAAATIIKMSGQAALVAQVAKQNNFIKLADVTQGPLMDWILTSGLTQAEIALIQRPFRPVTRRPILEPNPPTTTIVAGTVDADMRRAETKRLAAKYREIDRTLVKNTDAALDAAVDRLLKERPDLAWSLVKPART